jgi:hypothetical protein
MAVTDRVDALVLRRQPAFSKPAVDLAPGCSEREDLTVADDALLRRRKLADASRDD